MRQTVTVFGLTLVFLVALDGLVALTLVWAERSNRLGGLVSYFNYGRSVPGKLAQWETNPNMLGNLYDVAWRDDTIANSADRFQAENTNDKITIRNYGMSFTNNILKFAAEIDPSLDIDGHGGPAAPPNMTFALFEDDRDNRKAGDILVLGILSNSVPAMTALSNQTWAFEQPAPATYPIYRLEGDTLKRIDPIINGASDQRDLRDNKNARAAWFDQLKQEDDFFSFQTFGGSWLDKSPFARLTRRALAKSHIEATKQRVIDGPYPHAEVLKRMITVFAETAWADQQYPVVFLIQGRDLRDVDLLAMTQDHLETSGIPYLATAQHINIQDNSNFIADGHFQVEVDQVFARKFLTLVQTTTN